MQLLILYTINITFKVRSLDILDLLLSQGANINSRDNLGFTPLHKAVEVQDFTAKLDHFSIICLFDCLSVRLSYRDN